MNIKINILVFKNISINFYTDYNMRENHNILYTLK